jgi:hypothetical protein
MITTPAYFKIEGCERLFFKCAALRSTLSKEACGENCRRAQHLDERRVTCQHACRRCPIGAAHAGVKLPHESPFRGASICPRCRKFAGRMIAGMRCISCQNREYEFKKGKNAKGSKPALTLEPRRLGVIAGYGEPDAKFIELRAEHTKDAIELALVALRAAAGRSAFCRAMRRPATAAADFVAQMDAAPEACPPVVMFRRAPQAPLARAAPPRGQRPRLPVIDRTPNEARHVSGALDLRAVRERLIARVSA